MPQAEETRIVVWRVGEALLAAPLADTVEIAAVAGDGRAVSRSGHLELRTPEGLEPPREPRRAVVVESAAGPTAMAADEVVGVRSHRPGDVAGIPAWLSEVSDRAVTSLVRLDDDRIVALVAVDRLSG